MIADDIAKQMREEIDWNIIADLSKTDGGWIEVIIPESNGHIADEMIAWINLNCKYSSKARWDRWLFLNQQDADWFKLMWA
jgi:hypothetical protein